MNEEILKLNEWLEFKSLESKNHFHWGGIKNCWPEYYRDLKNIHLKESFRVSSIHWKGKDLLIEYLYKHKSEYNLQQYTGSCVYIKNT